jgi:hypothetical protein
MRRLLFLFSCGLALWVAIGARDAARRPAEPVVDDGSVLTLAQRSHVVSEQFGAALARAGVKIRRVDRALGRAATRLNSIAGD